MASLIWLIVVAVFIVIEIMTLGLTTIWFAGGALAAAIAAALGVGITMQILIFGVIAVVLMIFTRPIAMKYLNNRTQTTNVDSMAGKMGLVTQAIDNTKAEGQVTVAGLEWTARSTKDDITIGLGTKVVVREVQGVKLMVEKAEEVNEDK